MKPLFAQPYKASPEDAAAETRLDLLEQLEGMGRKRKVKSELMSSEGDLLSDVFRYTYDWRLTFNIRRLPKVKARPKIAPGASERWRRFEDLLSNLHERTITGTSASKAVSRLLRDCSQLEQKWYRRILLRDLRIGVALKSVLAAYPDLIPMWEVQVAGKMEDLANAVHLDYPLYADPKIDGIRATVVVEPNGNVFFRTRSGKSYDQYGHVTDQLAAMGPGWYDGEMYAGRWNETSAVMRLDPSRPGAMERIQSLKFHWFDLWQPDRPKLDFEHRKLIMMDRLLNAGDTSNIHFVPVTKLWTPHQVREEYLQCIEDGHEGIMLKRPDGLWSPSDKRDDTWIKVKPFVTVDAVVVDTYEGLGRNKGRLGGFVVEYEGTELKVGGGYTDEMRQMFWDTQDQYIGKVIEFKIQDDPQKVAVGRFNIFKRVREDRVRADQ